MRAISIILPVYKVQKFIGKCIESIINQSFRDFELIIVDDCGGDSSMEICTEKLLGSNLDYRIIKNSSNYGLSTSRNVGVKSSSGIYIMFVDSDDWVHPDILANLYNAAHSNKSDIISCRASYFWEDSGSLSDIPNLTPGVYRADEYLLLYFQEKVNPEAWGRLFKRELFDSIEFPARVNNEDLLTMPLLINKSKKVTQLKNVLYYYVKREARDSITNLRPTNIDGFLKRLTIFKKLDTESSTLRLNSKRFAYKKMLSISSASVFHANSYQQVRKEIVNVKTFIQLGDLGCLYRGVSPSTLPLVIILKLSPYLFFRIFKLIRP